MLGNGRLKNRHSGAWLLCVLCALGLACLALTGAAESRASDGSYVATDWVRRYKGPAFFDYEDKGVAVDSQGDVYVTGSARSDTGSFDFLTIKYDPEGRRLWVKRYHNPEIYGNFAVGLAVDGQGNVLVTGYSLKAFNPHWEDSIWVTIKYDGEGQLLWERFYDGDGSQEIAGVNRPAALVVDPQGNAYVIGSSFGDFSTERDYATIKYSPDGEVLWGRRYNGPGNGNDDPSSIILDGQGNVLVSGDSYGDGSDYDYATVKYSSDGEELWVRRYNGPADGNDYANALAVDAQGNVLVTGFTKGLNTADDYATIKYSSDGRRLWVRRFRAPGSLWNEASAMAVDVQGNVYVTGLSIGSGTHEDFTTIKYDPEGKRLWVRRYNGPGNAGDYPTALALDGQGNIYVTGYSVGVNFNTDYATIKYNPDGKRLWVRRYNGTANNYDWPMSLAVDKEGNVYVTGYSIGTAGSLNDYDFLTIKYTQTP